MLQSIRLSHLSIYLFALKVLFVRVVTVGCRRYAAVELGGMTIRVAIAEGTVENIVERTNFKTDTPNQTMPKVVAWLRKRQPFISLGVASFGPIDPRRDSPTYGYITTTPKVGG